MVKVIAIVNENGGVGKSTTAFCLSRSMVLKGKRVLLIDFDPLSDLPAVLNLDLTGNHSFADVLIGLSADGERKIRTGEVLKDEGLVFPTEYGFDVLSSGMSLVSLEMKLLDADSRESILRKALEDIKSNYDYVVIDTPSSCGLLTENALVAADYALIPVRCDYSANSVLTEMLQTIISVRNQANGSLSIIGILMTRCNPQGRSVPKINKELRQTFGDMLFKTIIFESLDLTNQYDSLTDEVLRRSL